MSRIVKELDSSKNVSSSIPTKILKMNSELCKVYITALYNNSLDNTKFPQQLKLAVLPQRTKGVILQVKRIIGL